ncbi:vWA domain-containing protein [Persephonella sp.]
MMRFFRNFILVNFLLYLLVSASYAKNIAFVIDATESLKNVLSKEIQSIKSIIELLSVAEKGSNITIVKFGSENEGEVIISTRIHPENINDIFNLIDENLRLNKLYKIRTAFSKGLSLILETGEKYDYTFFITDGEDNYKKSLEDFKKKHYDVSKLGKVIFILVPNNKTGYIRNKYLPRFNEWVRTLDAKVKKSSEKSLLFNLLLFISQEKIENKLAGYGVVNLRNNLEIEKYATDSKLVYIITPSIRLDKDTINNNGIKIYNGKYISYISINGQEGSYRLPLKEIGRRNVFFYETVNIHPEIKIKPHRDEYFLNESIAYSLVFKANNKIIKNNLFKDSLYCSIEESKTKQKKEGLLSDIEVGQFRFKKLGIYNLCIKYSYFPNNLISSRCTPIATIPVKKEGGLLEINLSSQNGYLYEFQPIKILARYHFIKQPESLKIFINNDVKTLRKIKNNLYSAILYLPQGNYIISPIGNKLALKGTTSFKVQPRNIQLKVKYGNKVKNIEELKTDDSLISIPVEYKYVPSKKKTITVWLKINPLFEGENVRYSYILDEKKEIPVKLKSYTFFPLVFGKDSKVNIHAENSGESIKLTITFPEGALDEVLENDIRIGKVTGIKLIDDRHKEHLYPDKDIIIHMKLDTLSKYIYLSKVTARFITFLIVLIAIILLLFLYYLYRLRINLKKKKIWREILSNFAPYDFYDDLPSRIKKELDKNKLISFNILPLEEQERVIELGTKWKMEELKEFLNKLKTPVENHRTKFSISDLPIGIAAFPINISNSTVKNIFLRDESLYGSVIIEHNGGFGEGIKITPISTSIKINDKIYAPNIPVILEYSESISISYGRYRIEIFVRKEENLIEINIRRL